jgi:Flp pilus assembly protein TadD
MRNRLLTLILGVSGILATSTGLAAPTADQLRQQGLAYRQQERYAEAIATLQQAVKLAPNNLSGWVMLGWTHHKAEQPKQAANVLLQAGYHDPSHVPAFNALGIVYLVGGDLPAAITTHSWAALLKPDNEIAYYNLSLAQQRSQEYEWAAITAQLAAQLEPDNPHPLVALAIADWSNGNQTLAINSYRQAINLDPRYADADFLNYLDEAGFTTQQIQAAKRVLAKV